MNEKLSAGRARSESLEQLGSQARDRLLAKVEELNRLTSKSQLDSERTVGEAEMVTLAQKGLDYDRIRGKYDEAKPVIEMFGEFARAALNQVRARVKLSAVTSSGKQLRDAIRLERRLELALEDNRLYDLRRWKDDNGKPAIDNIMGPNGTFVHYNLYESTDKYEKKNTGESSDKGITFKEGRDELFPIPNSEIIMSNGSIKQNPLY